MLNKDILTAGDHVQFVREYVYPFQKTDSFLTDWSTLIDGTNFERYEAKQAIRNGSKTYQHDSVTSFGYLKIYTPNVPVKFTLTGYTNCESADHGMVYIGSAAGVNTGTLMLDWHGTSTADRTATVTLAPNTDYYINISYAKDGSISTGEDRFYIRGLKFEGPNKKKKKHA